MIFVRSLLFNILFYVNLMLFLVVGSFYFFLPRLWAIRALQAWARTSLWLLHWCCGLKIEVRGLAFLPQGPTPLLVAGKHQSIWETFALLPYFYDPCMVLKQELSYIPFYGWFIRKFRMIGIERRSGAHALRKLVAAAKTEAQKGRQIIIMPEGTRQAPGATPDYKPGVGALYSATKLACLPFALNSGLYWPRRKFLRFPGTIIIAFLPPIAPGLPRKEFQQKLEDTIETTTNALIAEARTAINLSTHNQR